MTVAHIEIPEVEIADVCRRNGIRKLALFGWFLPIVFPNPATSTSWSSSSPQVHVGFFRLADIEMS